MGRTKTFIREEVLDKAIQLFWQKGFADTSLSDLEKATGVNKSGLYSEFKDKEDIFHECIKRYRDTHPAYAILDTAPYGWHNIENFIKSNMTCKGMKGCFFSNSMRDLGILPARTAKLMSDTGCNVSDVLKKNLKAAGVKKDLDALTNIITTFAGGISLKLNGTKPENLMDEVDAFMKMIKQF